MGDSDCAGLSFSTKVLLSSSFFAMPLIETTPLSLLAPAPAPFLVVFWFWFARDAWLGLKVWFTLGIVTTRWPVCLFLWATLLSGLTSSVRVSCINLPLISKRRNVG